MNVRERYNAKGRQSTAGGSRKHSKGKRNLKGRVLEDVPSQTPLLSLSRTNVDPNAPILIPKTQEEKEWERKERLRQELAAESNSKMNTKKRKRLDKYIEKKLKKEERVEIIEKLGHSQAQLPTTINLKSSSTLGTGKSSTTKQRLDKLEDKEVRRALDGRAGNGKRRRQNDTYEVVGAMESGSDEDEAEGEKDVDMSEDGERRKPTPTRQVTVVNSTSQPFASTSTSSTVGSALQRNPDGTVVAPKMKPLKGKKSAFQSWKHKGKPSKANVDEDSGSDTSFDSSDSAGDEDEDEDNEEGDGDEDSAGDGDEQNQDEDQDEAPKPKRPGFKDWAMKQLSTAKGYDLPQDSSGIHATEPDMPPPPPTKKRKLVDPSQPVEMRGPLGEDIKLPATSFAARLQKPGGPSSSSSTKVKAVTVARPPEVEEARLLLPIVTEEQPIMEAVLLNPVVVICGETGSGKTTQVPQFLYEAGFGCPGSENPGMIGITQPRRVAAISMASRVAQELSLPSSRVSYQIRYDATVSPSTSIKFMTDGVLLRELASDFLLSKYSVIIVDEAHERSMNTDILIGVLSRVVGLREGMWKEGKGGVKPLRLIIMSATLRITDFSENTRLFPSPPPVINVAARQHPVTVHFSRRTPSDYVSEAIKKATKIHARLPPGGILIFLTGQNEIQTVCRKLEGRFGEKALKEKRKRRGIPGGVDAAAFFDDPKGDVRTLGPSQADVEPEDIDLGEQIQDDLAFDVDGDDVDDDPDALDSDDERLDEELGLDSEESDSPMHIVPLYSLLPNDKQMRVFQPPPAGSRLVVVSTNVAETSLTIPGIRYVVDCGRAKERRYDVANGIQAFQVSWISKASASQRAGRAGRTGPGHCYRLYSSALFEHHFDAFAQPEILRMPIEGVVLQMKAMHIDAVVNFPFPTSPNRDTLAKAETTLTYLGALGTRTSISKGTSEVFVGTIGGQITELGKAMSLFPLSPRFSRMLVSGQQHGCLPYVISIVSALSVGDPFLRQEVLGDEENEEADDPEGKLSHISSAAVKAKEAQRIRRKAFFESQHRHSSLGNFTSDVFRILSVVGAYEYAGGGSKFCADHFVRPKAMEEIHKLRGQISNIMQGNFSGVDAGFVPNLKPPSDLQLKILRQLLTAGFIDQVAVRKDRVEQSSTGAQYATSKGVPYRALGVSEDVFIHPTSVLADMAPPEYIVFNEIVRTSRIWVKGVTVVNPAWLASLGKPTLCHFSKPTKNSSGTMMVIPRFGKDGWIWELPAVKADVQHVQ